VGPDSGADEKGSREEEDEEGGGGSLDRSLVQPVAH
jgi:hypothetical protein